MNFNTKHDETMLLFWLRDDVQPNRIKLLQIKQEQGISKISSKVE